MIHRKIMRRLRIIAPLLLLLFICTSASAQSPPDIRISNYLKQNSVQKGGSVQGIVEMDIPSGFHVHSNRPLEKFLIATQLSIEAPKGVRIGRVSYPRALLKNLKFSKNKVAVYEGRVLMRFTVAIPASYNGDSVDLRGKLRYQSCNDDLCFRPENRDFAFLIRVVK